MLCPSLLLPFTGKNWRSLGHMSHQHCPLPTLWDIGVVSNLFPPQTIVPEQEFVHSFNNHVTRNMLGSRCYVPGTYKGKQNRCGSSHQEVQWDRWPLVDWSLKCMNNLKLLWSMGLPNGSAGKESSGNVGKAEDMDSISEWERFPGGGNGNSLQYSCLKNPMDRGARQSVVHRVTRESDMTWWLKTKVFLMPLKVIYEAPIFVFLS